MAAIEVEPADRAGAGVQPFVIAPECEVRPVTIKRYANSRLYEPAAGRYLTLADLAQMVEDDEEFVVREAPTGEDITQSILRQIILERAQS